MGWYCSKVYALNYKQQIMRSVTNKSIYLFTSLLLIFPAFINAQESIGMATGNYSGVTGVWFNPANIADSRYKFDINIIGLNSYFNNNYLLVKNTAIVRRLFYRDPYNSSLTAVKNDLLQEQLPVNGKVYGRVESSIHFPLSFMATTGKRSAIALTMNNRTINKIDSMPVNLARAFFNELGDPLLYNTPIRADSLQYNFLNWQEVGLTYSRVILNGDHHFLKLGFTAKWLGANAGAYIQTDNAVVNFKNSKTLSVQSPLIHYARTERADIGQFNRKDIFNNLEDQAFGWDAGLVYEFRARVKKFKYVNESLEEQTRRDMNKYMFRIGLSLVDMGKFTLNKRALTNDHSANILNWDFSNVKATNFSQWDTAYSKKITYISGAPATFTYRLPAALIANFDLHLFAGFYVNLAAKAPFESFKKATDTYISANRWIAVTARFEGKFLGIYVPVIRQNNRTNIGATIKFGPVYIGSNNLAQILSNESSYEADFHAGLRLSIPHGKPTKFSKYAQNILYGKTDTVAYKTVWQKQLDALQHEIDDLKKGINDSTRVKAVQIIINNDGVTSTVEKTENGNVVIKNNVAEQQLKKEEDYNRQQNNTTDSLIRKLAEKNIEVEHMKRSANEEKKESKKGKGKKKEEPKVVETSNKEMEQEMERIRKQMAIQNAVLIGGGTAAVIASGNSKGDSTKGKDLLKDSASVTIKDSPVNEDSTKSVVVFKTDTIYIRDTIRINENANDAAYKLVDSEHFEPILFAKGSSNINKTDKNRIVALAATVKQHSDWRIEITGMTDATGSVAANRKMASVRSNAVTTILLKNGVKDNQFISRSKLADTNNIAEAENPRRVAIRILSH
jgi:outer membrane protein OmpA-like peptidoglycan-associated protein